MNKKQGWRKQILKAIKVICQPKIVLCVSDHLHGVKSGKKIGTKSSTAVMLAEPKQRKMQLLRNNHLRK